ncbi:hypothetical protein EYF80_053562 [Liparis tanakae]|uniref:Uncharacterized protein n=1 Tax=Liparis tanakae TaxID=230148 RepID=A0A4Z2F5U3_9TELE|nr:hypothetical protein EYF80_053562 [Liparis tanakae]
MTPESCSSTLIPVLPRAPLLWMKSTGNTRLLGSVHQVTDSNTLHCSAPPTRGEPNAAAFTVDTTTFSTSAPSMAMMV